jgi:glycosyltransferase involved in cell wall biosynthesis
MKNQLELFLGYPSDETKLRMLLADKVIGKNIKHVGKFPFNEIVQLLKCATAFVMPNISIPGDMEGFGLVCLEASLCGAPVFAASSGGIPDAVRHNRKGILLPSGDAGAWVSALNSLVENPKRHSINAAEAKDYTQHSFSWTMMVEKYNGAFLRLCGTQ